MLRFKRSPLLAAVFIVLAIAFTAMSSIPAMAQSGSHSSGSQSGSPSGGSADDLKRLLETLEDPTRRDALAQDIRGLLEVSEAANAGQAEHSGDLGDQLNEVVKAQTDRVSGVFDQLVAAVTAIESLPEWLDEQMTDPGRRAFWVEIATVGIAFPILVALLARWLAALVLGRAIRRIRATNPQSMAGRLATGAIVTVFEALTVAAVLGAGWVALHVVGRSVEAEKIAGVLILAIALQSALGVFGRTLLAPFAPDYRPLPIENETAAYLYTWLMRLTFVGVMGYVISRIAIPIGAGASGGHALEIATAAIMAGMLIILVLQTRHAVADIVRGPMSGSVRRRIADVWHLLAIAYVILGFGIFVAGVEGGFLFLIRATAITAVTCGIAVGAARIAGKGLRMLFELDPDLDQKYPGLRERSNLYRPVLQKAVNLALILIAAVVILTGWDIDIVGALEAETRTSILRSTMIVILVIAAGVLIWEMSSSAIERALSGTNADGTPREASSRAKTLLPLLRRVILFALVLFCGLIVLSEVGMDIGPLLAGAGVLGLAIGFGSQALVRDVITGLFILIEDTVSVGDVVTAGGHTGIVEDLSIRTIKMRDIAGSLHVVPFGDVTTVVNMTKEYSYAVMDVGVAYREDTDHVSTILREVAQDIADDPEWGWKLLEPLDMMGVHALGDSAVVIRCRVKTKPILQFGVQREFNRRIKKRFDQEGIEIPFPHTTIYFGVDKAGSAPPARVLMEAEDRALLAETQAPSYEVKSDSVDYGRAPD